MAKRKWGYVLRECYSTVGTVNGALKFLVLDAEIMASCGDGLLNRYDVERLTNINFIADYIRDLETRYERLRGML